jgi:hypothetical protein
MILFYRGCRNRHPDKTADFILKNSLKEISACLNKKGVFAFKLPSSENFWTTALQKRNASIYKTLKAVFNDIVVLPGTSNIFIASNDSLTRDPVILSERLRSRRSENKLVTPEYINYIYKNDRFNEIAGLLNDSTAVINTDIKPICYQYTTAIWLSKFFPGYGTVGFYINQNYTNTIIQNACCILHFYADTCRKKMEIFQAFLPGFYCRIPGNGSGNNFAAQLPNA